AAAGKEFGIETIGIIRGDELNESSNPALRFASTCGMKLYFISREDYRKKNDEGFLLNLLKQFQIASTISQAYLLHEGGANEHALKGCAEIVEDINVDFDYICCACGTGATLAGITLALKENQQALGVSVLHGEEFLESDIQKWNNNKTNFKIIH